MHDRPRTQKLVRDLIHSGGCVAFTCIPVFVHEIRRLDMRVFAVVQIVGKPLRMKTVLTQAGQQKP